MTDWRVSSAVQAALFVLLALAAVIVARGALRSWVFTRVFRRERAVVVGAGADAQLFQNTIAAHPEFGVDVVAVLEDTGSPMEVEDAVAELQADRVVLTSSSTSHDEMLEMVRSVRKPYVQVSIVPRYHELFTSNATLEDVEGVPIVTLRRTRLRAQLPRCSSAPSTSSSRRSPLMLLSPALLAVAIAVRVSTAPARRSTARPRRGRGGSTFLIDKFRTMFVDAESRRDELLHLNEVDGPLFKIKGDDPRVTRVGGFLRRCEHRRAAPAVERAARRHEPRRAARPSWCTRPTRSPAGPARRLDTTPGITGLWQVLGRNDIPFEEMVKLDYLYVTNWSLWWDVRILYQTVPVVLQAQGGLLMTTTVVHVDEAPRPPAVPPTSSSSRRSTRRPTCRGCSPTSRPGRSSSRPGSRLIIVDDGSADDTVAVVRAYHGPLPLEVIRARGEPGSRRRRSAPASPRRSGIAPTTPSS